jgi:predicted porin
MHSGNAENISSHQSRDQITITHAKSIRFHLKVAARKFLLSAAIFSSVATIAHAEDSSDTKTQSGQLRQQNQILAKKLADLEQRLHKLEARSDKKVVDAPTISPNGAPINYDKAPVLAAKDDSLTWNGITLYGAIDMGLAYQTHGSPLSNSAGFGLGYLISKNSNNPYFGVAPNALTASNIGLKGDEQLFPGLSAIFNLQTSFLPTSGRLSDGLGSIVQNNGLPVTSQSTFADSSKDGQALNTAAWAGLSSPTWGTVTYGRQNALTLDGVIAYDPMGGSGAFSVIGFQGATAGGGDTENARLDNSLKYLVHIGAIRIGVAGQLGPNGTNTRDDIQAQLGFDYQGASFDAIYGHINDAVSSAPLAVGFAPTAAQLASAGQGLVAGTVSDNNSLMLLGKYGVGPVKLFAGYEFIQFSNPKNPLAVGTDIIGGYTLGTVSNTTFPNDKHLQVFWTGATYDVRPDVKLMFAYYHEQQNSFGVVSCSNNSLSTCSGQLDAVSMVADWHFAKRFDAYAGAMYSQVRNGLANGFLRTNTIDPTVGLRYVF